MGFPPVSRMQRKKQNLYVILGCIALACFGGAVHVLIALLTYDKHRRTLDGNTVAYASQAASGHGHRLAWLGSGIQIAALQKALADSQRRRGKYFQTLLYCTLSIVIVFAVNMTVRINQCGELPDNESDFYCRNAD